MNAGRLSKIPLASDGKPLRAMVRIATNRDKLIPKDYEHLIPSETTVISSHVDLQMRAMRAHHFNGSGITLSRYLTDELVGDGKSSVNPPRLPLKTGDWAFVYWSEKIYTGQGTLLTSIRPNL